MSLHATVYRDDREEEELASARLGNVSMIGYLRDLIREKAPTSTVLLSKVLYSGSHCGDTLTIEEIRQIRAELDYVSEKLSADPGAREFVASFGEVINAALHHARPVTF